MIYGYARTGETAFDPDQVERFLLARGFLVGPGGVASGTSRDAQGQAVAWVRADLDRDPGADLDQYAPVSDPARQAVQYLAGRVRDIRATAPAQRTTAERDLLALVAVLRADL